MRNLPAVIVSTLLLALSAASSAAAAPSITGIFPLKGATDTNSKIVEGPEGNIWLPAHNEAEETAVAMVTPDGKVTEYKLEDGAEKIQAASGIAVGPEKKLWVTATNKVASFSPSDPEGTVKVFKNNLIDGADPIVAGPDGQMWAGSSEELVHFKPSEPEKEEAFPIAEMGPRDIEVQGNLLVIADAGAPRILKVNTSGEVQKPTITIGHEKEGKFEGASQGIAVAPDGAIGFTQPGKQPEQVGFVTPTGTVQAFEREGDPFGAAYGSDHAFWFALAGAGAGSPAGIERVTESGEQTFFDQVTPKFKVRQITSGPGNTIWATEEPETFGDPGAVVRVSGLEPPTPTPQGEHKAPDTKLKGPKGKVKTRKTRATIKFTFSSSIAGSKFECALVKSSKKRKTKASTLPKGVVGFRPCQSPKKLKLRPGRYRFSVRAIAGGLRDPTPATRSFSVVRVRLHSHGVG